MEVENRYKLSGIGIFPTDWDINPLENYFSYISYGFTNPMPESHSGIYMITAADINNGKINFETARKTPEWAFNKLLTNKSRPNKGDILLTKDGTLGRLAIVGDEIICINQSVAVIRPNNRISGLFLKYLLEHSYYQKVMLENAGGSTIKHIYITIVNKMLIGVPNYFTEQVDIAKAFSDMDSLIVQIEKLIEKKKAIKQGIIQHLLSPYDKEGKLKVKWREIRIGDYGKTYGGLTGKSKKDFGFGQSQYIPFMNIMNNPIIDVDLLEIVNVRTGENQNKAQYLDLFFNGSSETPEELGMCSILLDKIENLFLNSFCFGFRLYSDLTISGLFLTYFFRSSYGRQILFSLAQGATRYNLSKTNFLNLTFFIPNKEEQDSIAAIIRDLDEDLRVSSLKLEKLQFLKQSMMQSLLTGKIRIHTPTYEPSTQV